MKYFSTDILKDFIVNNGGHKIYTKEEEQYMLKNLKLSFLSEVGEEQKKEYLAYYLEVNPDFLTEYQKAENKEEVLMKAIKKSFRTREEFIKNNLKLVIKLAKESHKIYSIELIDLISTGNIGLMIALKNFDLKRNLKFSSYAVICIESQIKSFINNRKMIHFPKNKIAKFNEIVRKAKEYYQFTGKEANQAILKSFGLSNDEIESYNIYISKFSSLNEPVIEEEKELGDFLASEENISLTVENKLLNEKVDNLLNSDLLTDEEREILKLRYGFYGECQKLKEVSSVIKRNISTTRLYEQKALSKLKKVATKKKIK